MVRAYFGAKEMISIRKAHYSPRHLTYGSGCGGPSFRVYMLARSSEFPSLSASIIHTLLLSNYDCRSLFMPTLFGAYEQSFPLC